MDKEKAIVALSNKFIQDCLEIMCDVTGLENVAWQPSVKIGTQLPRGQEDDACWMVDEDGAGLLIIVHKDGEWHPRFKDSRAQGGRAFRWLMGQENVNA